MTSVGNVSEGLSKKQKSKETVIEGRYPDSLRLWERGHNVGVKTKVGRGD